MSARIPVAIGASGVELYRGYGTVGQARKPSGEKLEPRWPLVPFRSSWALTKEVGAVCRDQGPGRDSSLSA